MSEEIVDHIPSPQITETPNPVQEVAPVEQATESHDATTNTDETSTEESGASEANTEKKTAWWMREIGEQRQKNQALKAELELLRQHQQAKPQAQNGISEEGQTPKGDITQADIDRMVLERAMELRQREVQIAQQRDFDNTCNTIFEKGTKEHPGFEESVQNLHLAGVLSENNTPTSLMSIITKMPDDAPKLIDHLAKNMDEATRLKGLPIVDQTLAIAQLRSELKNVKAAAVPISGAPKPITPISATSKADPSLEKANSVAEHMALRNKQREAAGLKPLFSVRT